MSRRRIDRLSTRLALSLGALIVAAGLVVGVLLALGDRRARFERSAVDQQQVASEFAARLSADMDERVKDAVLLGGWDAFVEGSASEQREILEGLTAANAAYAWVGVTDLSGVVQAASPSGFLQGMDVSERPWWQAGRDGLFVGDVHDALLLAEKLGTRGGQPPRFVDIALPLVDDDGRTTGVLGVHLFWSWTEDLRDQVLNAMQDDERDVVILDTDGQVLLPPAGVRTSGATPELLEAIDGSGRGVLGWTDGEYVTGWAASGAFGAFEGLGWTVVSRQPAAPLARSALFLGAEIIVGALLTALLVASVAWWRIQQATGQIRTITVAAQLLRDGHEATIPLLEETREVSILSATLRELTEHLTARQRELECRNEQLAEAIRARDNFTMMASHETRTPITVIKGSLQSLRQHHAQLTDDTREKLLEAAWRNVNRIERLNAQMLLAAEVETGLAPTGRTTETVMPAQLLSSMSSGVTGVTVEGPAELTVRLDPALVELTVGNLLDNAERYGEPPVTVAFESTDGMLRIRVRDHGPGVPDEFSDKLFQRYAQASEGLRRTAVGAGLGLWLSREVLRAAGGDVVHEQVQGPGALFIAVVPIVEVTTGRAELDGAGRGVVGSGSGSTPRFHE